MMTGPRLWWGELSESDKCRVKPWFINILRIWPFMSTEEKKCFYFIIWKALIKMFIWTSERVAKSIMSLVLSGRNICFWHAKNRASMGERKRRNVREMDMHVESLNLQIEKKKKKTALWEYYLSSKSLVQKGWKLPYICFPKGKCHHLL